MGARRRLRAAWADRPTPVFPRKTWALILALDRLPWPWGENIMACCFVAKAFVRIERLRQALAWASARQRRGRRRWALAISLCFHHGRFVARSMVTGIQDLVTLRQLVRLRGQEHLAAAAGRGRIFLGFHLGPTSPDIALRLAGHRVTWIGAWPSWAQKRNALPPEIQELYASSGEHDALETRPSNRGQARVRALYRARQLLTRGRDIFITADGAGQAAFELSLPGGPAKVCAGWLLLRQTTGASVLPVLSHMEGHTQVVTIHPALPSPVADPGDDLKVCREALGRLLTDHVRRFPEQCYFLAFAERRRAPRHRETDPRLIHCSPISPA